MNTESRFLQYLSESSKSTQALNSPEFLSSFSDVCDLLIRAIQSGKKIFVAGNGGSHSDSLHIAGELVNYFTRSHKALPVMALGANGTVLTAWANDHSYENQFQRELSAFATEGDVFIGITTSGKSKNILNCFKFSKDLGLSTICLTGTHSSEINYVNFFLKANSDSTPHIQESHIVIYHALCKEIEFRIQ